MTVEFSNKWYRETCLEAGLNPDNILSQSEIDLARKNAVSVRMYQIAKKNYPDPKVQTKIDEQIKRLNEERIGHMFNALDFAEFMGKDDSGFNNFLEHQINRRNKLLRG